MLMMLSLKPRADTAAGAGALEQVSAVDVDASNVRPIADAAAAETRV